MADPILNPGEVEGTLRFTMETGTLYMDSGETRIEITDFVKGLTEAQIRATIQPLPKVYIAVDSKRLLVYDNDLHDWITIGGTGAVEWADYAGTASYANNAGTASKAISANNATNAGTAVYSVESRHAGLADTATFAQYGGTSTDAEHAVHADTAAYAEHAGTATEANHAVNADTSTYARNAGTATEANHAINADTSTYARNAGTATEANHAVNADTSTYARNAGTSVEAEHAVNADTSTYARNAGTALHAGTSDYATKAGTATEANHAATAAYAVHATSADLATTALYAQSGGSSSEAEHATYADTATYATKAGTATEANHAVNADTSTFARNAETSAEAEHAVNADTATYARNAGTAVNAGTATHAGTADYATKAGTATEANHAVNADTATYARNAGTATEANHAVNADTSTYARNAGTALHAGTSDYATKAGTATEANHAVNADTATYARNAGTAVHAGTSDYATKASSADYATTAMYALNGGTSGDSQHATYADTATYAINAGTALTANKLSEYHYYEGFKDNGTDDIIHYAVCATNSNTETKYVYLNNLYLKVGTRIIVKFLYINSANYNNLKLKINEELAKPILYKDNIVPNMFCNVPNCIYEFVYDGSNFCIVGDLDRFKEFRADDGIAYDSDANLFYNTGIRELVNSATNGYITKNLNGTTSNVMLNAVHQVQHSGNGYINVKTNGSTADVKLNAVHNINNSPNNGYIRVNTDGSTADVMLNAVHKIENSPTNGYMRVTTNGSTSDVLMNGVSKIEHGTNGNIVVTTNGTTSNVKLNSVHTIANSPNNGYIRVNTDGSTSDVLMNSVNNIVNSTQNGYININKNGSTSNVMLNAVHKIENSPTNGYIRVTTNGSTSDVKMNAVHSVVKSGDNLIVNTNGTTSSITMDYAGRATDDESGNNIKATYANSLSVNGYTLTLKNKNGGTLSTVNTTESKTIVGASNSAKANAVATDGAVYLNHIENDTVKSAHNIKGNTIAVTSDANGTITLTNTGIRNIVNSATNGYININKNGTTSNVMLNAVHKIENSPTNGYMRVTTNGSTSDVLMNSVSKVEKVGDNLVVTTNGSTSSITMDYAGRATDDESGNNIKATYANSLSVSGYTLTLKNKNGTALSTVNTTESMTVTTNASTGTSTAAATNGNLFLNHIENNTVKSSHNIKGTSISVTSDADGVITLTNTGVRSIATGGTNGTITVNTNGGTAEVAVKGLGSRAYDSTSYLPLAGGTMSGNISFSNSGTAARGIYGTVASNDGWRIVGAGTADNAGYLEIATKDDASEPIYVRQYTGDFATLTRTATLLDASGNTSFPGSLTANSIDATKLTGSIPASTNSGVRAIAKSGSAGYINVNTNGTTANVEVNGAPKAVKSITRSGTTFTATCLDGSTFSFTQQDNNTTYSANNGVGLSGTTFYNSGVRAIAEGGVAGTINVNTNGATANVAVKDAGKAVKSITRSGTTFTATAIDGSTFSFTQQDNNTTYSANNGVGLSGTTFYNSGVRAAATGTTNGTININTNGSTADVAVKGLGSAAYTNSTAYAASGHTHGLLHSDFTASVNNTTADSGWSMINSTYNGYLLKSIRYQGSSPAWGVGNYGSGICFGGSDTKGLISVAYNAPNVKIAGGNGTAPVWWIGLTGTSGTSYNLAQMATQTDISTLQSNFQAGVDSVYNAIVAQGTTPASKSLSDVVTGIGTLSTNRYNAGTKAGYNTKVSQLTATYTPTGSGGSKLDMGSNHNNRYVNTNTVYNTGTTNGYNAKVAQLTGTYTPTGSGGSKLDMGSNHNQRYVNTNTVYNTGTTNGYNAGTTAGYNAKVAQLTGTYTPTGSGGSKLDMGSNHNQRYVNTNTVYNTGTTNGYNAKVAQLTGTYTPTGSGGSKLDMGSNHNQRYVNTNNVYAAGQANPPTQTKTCTPSTSAQTVSPDSGKFLSSVTVNAIPNLHTSNSMIVPRWGTGPGSNVPASQVATRNPRIDFGSTATYGNAEMIEIAMPAGYYAWSYGNSSCCIPTETQSVTAGTSDKTVTPTEYNTSGKYVKFLKSVTVKPTPSQEKTITASRSAQTVTPDSGKLLSKVTVNKYPDASGTYEATSRGSALDMGATNNLRYVNTNGVPNSNSDTYTFPSGDTGGTKDLTATNTYRYVNATNVYNKGTATGYNSGTAAGYTSGYNAGTKDGYATKRNELTGTYTPTSRSSKLDMGSNHKYRYVDTNSVPNSNSDTYTLSSITKEKNMGATNTYQYCKPNYTAGIIEIAAKADNAQYQYTLADDGFYIVTTSLDTRYATSSTVTVSLSNSAGTKVFSYTSNSVMKTYGIKVSGSSCILYVTSTKSYWVSVAKVY